MRQGHIFRGVLLATSALVPLGLAPAYSNPQGGQVVGGSASIATQGATTTITQTTERAVINWNTFNINSGETTKFVQPNAGSIALNRVTGGLGPSTIYGNITANGQVWIINPAGILIGSGAVVNTAGFLATTSDIKNDDFMAGRNHFIIPGRPDASVVNLGTITATNGGFAALVAPGVRNSGTITAKFGKVALASANTFSLDFYGDGLITLGVNDAIAGQVKDVATGETLKSLITNDGVLSANGGRVELTAVSARQIVDSVINTSGVIEARSIGHRNGMIVLGGQTSKTKVAGSATQTVKVSGTLNVSGKKKGGTVKVTGENIELASANIKATGGTGGGTVMIGGDTGGGTVNAAVASIEQAKLSGGPVPTADTVSVDANSTIDVSATQTGNGGKAIVWSDLKTVFAGTVLAKGGAQSGNGGFVEVSSKKTLSYSGSVSTRAVNGNFGTLLLDPDDYFIGSSEAATIMSNLANGNVIIQTSASGTGGSGDITVGANITWGSGASANSSLTLTAYRDIKVNSGVVITNSGAGNLILRADNTGTGTGTVSFLSSGDQIVFTAGSTGNVFAYYNPTTFGTSDFQDPSVAMLGQGNLTAYMLVNDVDKLQNINGNLSGNYALAKNIDASGRSEFSPIGSSESQFSGRFDGQGYVIDHLSITSSASNVGLFGYSAGTISNVGLTNVSINLTGTSQYAGALAGSNLGTITNAYSTGAVSNADNTTPFYSATGAYGGLVGRNDKTESKAGSISRSYSTATVHATGPTNVGWLDAGGLVGQNHGSISQSYATGAITGTYSSTSRTFLGGLVGWQVEGSIEKSYAIGSVTGTGYRGDVGGLIGAMDSGTITQTWSSGAVAFTGTESFAGGLIGTRIGGTVNQSYWDKGTSGQLTSAGGTGLTTLEARTKASFVGWSFVDLNTPVADWVMIDGQTRPFLTSEFSTTITNTHQFQLMAMNASANYKLANNINFAADLANPSSMWASTGLTPFTGPYTGIFDGQGYTVSNVVVNGPALLLINAGTIQNLTLANFSVHATANNQQLGILAGQNNGTISNVGVSGTVSGGTYEGVDAGGLVGYNTGTIRNSYSTAAVTSDGINATLGGLVGYNWGALGNANSGLIQNSRASGNVTATASLSGTNCGINFCNYIQAGGLVGNNLGRIEGTALPYIGYTVASGTGTYATGNVSVGSAGTAGGLVGQNEGIIDKAEARGAVTGAAGIAGTGDSERSTTLGGFAGYNHGTITNSTARGNVGFTEVANAYLQVGGFVGHSGGTIGNSHAFGDVRAGNNSSAGGFAADSASSDFNCNGCTPGLGFNNDGVIGNSTAIGSVTVGAASAAGGFVAFAGDIANSTASGAVTGGGNSLLGGFAAVVPTETLVANAHASGNVTSNGSNTWIGGFAAVNAGFISLSSSASGNVQATSDSVVGGLVGVNVGQITGASTGNSEVYQTVSVNGTNNLVGGLVGANFGGIFGSTANTNVTGGAGNTMGSLVGANGNIANVESNLVYGSPFPVGRIIDSIGNGTVNGNVGPQVGTFNLAKMPTAPSIVQQCDDSLCQILTNPKLKESPTTTDVTDLPDDVFATALILSLLTTDNKATQAAIGEALISIPSTPAPAAGGQGQGGTNVNTASTNNGSTGVRTASQTPGAPPPAPPPPPLRPVAGPDGERFSSIPPLTENRFIQNEVVLQMGINVPLADVQRVAQSMGLTILSQQSLNALGRNAYRFSVGGGRSVRDVIRALEANSIVAVAQPNYQYSLSQANAPASEHKGDPAQYMVEKLQLEQVHRMVSGKNVTIAVIDSEADKQHTELNGAIAEQFNAVGEAEKAHSHGTAMVGAISSRDRLLGVAPGAKILAVRAFSESQQSAEGTTFHILKSIDWAVSQGARVINMSFAGPRDPALERTLKRAYDQGVVLVAAAGNAGPKSPPLYPGADPSVIAVTATDAVDRGFKMANQGAHVSVASPGVDVLAPAPQEAYQMSTGTSIATAHVSGVVALMLERDPTLTPADVRKILESTATDLGPKGKDTQFGWGLVNPQKAIQLVDERKRKMTQAQPAFTTASR